MDGKSRQKGLTDRSFNAPVGFFVIKKEYFSIFVE